MHERLQQDRIYVASDLLILSAQEGKLQILLSRRTGPPYAHCWALPGRFVALGESVETAGRLLLREMLPIRDAFMEQLYTFSDVSRDPRGRVVSIASLVIIPSRKLDTLLPGSSLKRFTLRQERDRLLLAGEDGEALSQSDLAFDHGAMIAMGLQRLRGKLDYTDIAFHFLSNTDAFSLGELQEIFEAILDRSLDSSNFRRAILNRYVETGRIRQTALEERRARGRPAALYQWTEQ